MKDCVRGGPTIRVGFMRSRKALSFFFAVAIRKTNLSSFSTFSHYSLIGP